MSTQEEESKTLISQAVAEWLIEIKRLSPETQYGYKHDILDFISNVGCIEIDELNPQNINKYIKNLFSMGYKASTVNNYIVVLRSFGRFLLETYNVTNPCSNLKKYKVRDYYQPFITREQYEKILASATQKEADLIRLLSNTGLRASEIANLKFENIIDNFSNIRFIGKGGKERTVPLNNEAKEILAKHCKDERIIGLAKSRRAVHDTCSRAGKRAGEPCLTPHMLRRYFGSELVHHGVSILIVSKLLGHSSAQVTERYLKVSSAYLNGSTDVLCDEKIEPEKEPIATEKDEVSIDRISKLMVELLKECRVYLKGGE